MKVQTLSDRRATVDPRALMSTGPSAPATVLFVDDETSLLDGLRDALRKEPFEILTAASAAQGLEILGKRSVDVVVSDERMPGMSGSEFVAVVRQRWPETMRIIMTGQASLEAAIRAINEGEIYRFLTKPCSPVQLGHTIRDALVLKSLMRESARLLAAARRQRTQIEQLERDHPGIAQLARTADGAIVVDEDECDPAALIEQIRRELGDSTSR